MFWRMGPPAAVIELSALLLILVTMTRALVAAQTPAHLSLHFPQQAALRSPASIHLLL